MYTSARQTYGSGAIASVNPAKSAIAPTFPIRLNIGRAISGNATQSIRRKKAFDAITEAALERYVDTRNVKTDVKHRITPQPKGMDARIGTIQCTCG